MNEEKSIAERLEQSVTRLGEHLERAHIEEYIGLLKRPFKFMFLNFMVGIARGVGLAVGMTVVVAVIAYIFSKMVDLPIIGAWIAQLVEFVNTYLQRGIR